MCVICQGKLCVIVAGAALVVAAAPELAAERTYYIAVEDVVWNYAPTRQNLVHGGKIPAPWTRNTRWKKTRYVEYTDGTLSVRTPQPEWLGVLGPGTWLFHCHVGDHLDAGMLTTYRIEP